MRFTAEESLADQARGTERAATVAALRAELDEIECILNPPPGRVP